MTKTPKKLQIAYIFVILQYIKSVKSYQGSISDFERKKILNMVKDIEDNGIFIEDKEPIFTELNT